MRIALPKLVIVVFAGTLTAQAITVVGTGDPKVDVPATRDDQGEMTSIEGGTNPFYIEAPGGHVTIQGLHFIHSKACVIRVVAASGLAIDSNRIEGVVRDTNFAWAVSVSTSPGENPPNAGDGQPENISGTLLIANVQFMTVMATKMPFIGRG
jgi:hypothetical protein